MFKYCSSMALLSLVGVGCGAKVGDDSSSGAIATGGSNNLATGGATSSTVATNTGGAASISTTAPADGNLFDLTQNELDQINAVSCTGWSAEGEFVPANIEFIVDTSASMGETRTCNGSPAIRALPWPCSEPGRLGVSRRSSQKGRYESKTQTLDRSPATC